MENKIKDGDQESKTVKISDILEISGKYQIIQYFYICLPAIFVSMSSVNYVFVAKEVNYRCRVPECEISYQFNVSWWPSNHIDQCTKPILNRTIEAGACTNNSFITATELCTEWIYENNDTIVSKFNLACKPWSRNFIGVVHSIGMGCAMLIAGCLADYIGRKPALVICSMACVLGNLKTLSTSYLMYVCFEFLEAATSAGAFTAGGVLLIELGSKKNRLLAGVLFAYAVYLGEAIFAVIAMFVPYWKTLVLTICSPAILFIFLTKTIFESPRWLVLNGKVSQAKDTLKTIVKLNKIDINISDLDNIDEHQLKVAYNIESHQKKEGFREVLKCKELLKRFLAAFVCRFMVAFIYYGLVVNSVGLPGNQYVNFLLGAIMSFPGELISMYMMNKFGRKLPLIFGYLLSGISCIVYGFIPESYFAAKIAFFLAGKLIAAACYTGIVTFTMELFPTSVRGSLLGLCTLASCTGNMIGLMTPMLVSVYYALASVCFGLAGIVSSILLTITPETRDLPLADTIEQIAKSVGEKSTKTSGEKNVAYTE